jgi:hypothetical protein
MSELKQIEWTGLYNESWQGEITPEAFSHPACVILLDVLK